MTLRRSRLLGFAALLALGLVCGPTSARAAEISYDLSADVSERAGQAPDGGRKAYDLLVLRPLGFVQVVVSALVFVPAYPVALLVSAEDEVRDICITRPVDQTFRRPLGRL